MVYIYLPATYDHLNLDVTKDNLVAVLFSAVSAVFLDHFHLGTIYFMHVSRICKKAVWLLNALSRLSNI